VALDQVVGHERVREFLARTLAASRVPPALLFSGPSGVGKKTLALALLRALLCDRQDPRGPCDACPTCRRCLKGVHPDLILLEPETASIKIDQVREIVGKIAGLPYEGRARGVVVDSAECLTEEAENALLKSLEEPPKTSHVCLVTSSPQALLQTVRSRCQEVRMGSLPARLIEARLAETLDPDEARLRAALSGGSLGAALGFESEGYRATRDDLLAILEGLGKDGALGRLGAAERLADAEDPFLVLVTLRGLLRDVAVTWAGVSGELLNPDVRERLERLAQTPLGGRAAALAERVAEVREGLEGNANRLLSMDVLLEAFA
jgi:DNA polymerase-3 subunit delta'